MNTSTRVSTRSPTMPVLIVVSELTDWPHEIVGVRVLTAREYLTHSETLPGAGCRVYNLCRSYRYQRLGYYVSLLAAARGHRPLPSVETIQAIKSSSMARFVGDQIDELMQKSLAEVEEDRLELRVWFGVSEVQSLQALAAAAFRHFPSPMFRLQFERRRSGSWRLRNVQPMAPNELEPHLAATIRRAAVTFLSRRIQSPPVTKSAQYDMAILCDERDQTPPSNEGALRRFTAAAARQGFDVERLDDQDLTYTAEFDALFIRQTTSVNDVTYRFAQKATAEGLVVIDDPQSILRCTNKVFQAEILTRHGIATPKTIISYPGQRSSEVIERIEAQLGLPCILKQPDSSFSLGVTKVDTRIELSDALAKLAERSDLVIAQAFVPTQFDWRIGIIDRRAIYACRYHMADAHWQIIHRNQDDGSVRQGDSGCVPLTLVPAKVMQAALAAANLMGHGLYGVDIKELDGRPLVIEVNDNPSIDKDVEDELLGDQLYDSIMRVFRERLEQRRHFRPRT